MSMNPRLAAGAVLDGDPGEYPAMEYHASADGDGAWVVFAIGSAVWALQITAATNLSAPLSHTPQNFSDSTMSGTFWHDLTGIVSSANQMQMSAGVSPPPNRLFIPPDSFFSIYGTTAGAPLTLSMIIEEV